MEDGADVARMWAKGAVRLHSCTGQAHHWDTVRKGGQPATRGTWTRGGWGTRSGGGAGEEGAKAKGLVRVRNRRGMRTRGSTRLKSPTRWINPSLRPRGPSATRGNRARSSVEGTPIRGCGMVNGAGKALGHMGPQRHCA